MTEAKSQRGAPARARTREERNKGDRSKTGKKAPNSHWRKTFLECLAETSNVSASVREAGVCTSRAYRLRRNDPAFRKEWRQALLEGYEHLEMETLHRLRFGVAKDDNRFDIANALRLLALHSETIARERALESEQDEESVLASLNAKIDAMRSREAAVAQMLAEDARGSDGS